MPNFNSVIHKYRDEYFRSLVIEHHLNELHDKMHKLIAEDETPFHCRNFLKELADLYILLELVRTHDKDFASLIEDRKELFISKVKA